MGALLEQEDDNESFEPLAIQMPNQALGKTNIKLPLNL